ncbi:amidase [Nocardia lijiangensis]|uniref:amidase n=1 Tax=Nocardia lijiangensis TaxID=299618 RepID=UPI0009FFAE7D|nr:amidase [Nocardia lijiangensis]
MADRVHAFTDDALADRDAVALAALIRSGEVSPEELAQAAIVRAERVEPTLHAIQYECFDPPRYARQRSGVWYGVPTLIKDNADVAGMPTRHGSVAFQPRPATRDDAYTRQFLSTGVTLLGKTRLPEFGLNPTTEFQHAPPTVNPWNPEYSAGGSSGGGAALVAAGVVPVAHGNDGGGSLRIPAACAGLVALKPSRFRHLDNAQARQLPIKLVSEGVLTRTMRDTAMYTAAAERYWHNPKLAPIGMVEGPGDRRLRTGLLLASGTGDEPDAETRAAVERAARLLEKAGHHVEPMDVPFARRLAEDFLLYWALLAHMTALTGKILHGRSFDRSALDDLTKGLGRYHRERFVGSAAALYRLRRAKRIYDDVFTRYDIVLSPVTTHAVPPLGYLSPTVPADELIDRLFRYAGYTPMNNVAGSPAISVPTGLGANGLPVGVMCSAAYGDERTLLEIGYLLEAENPFPRITASE